MPEHDNDPDIVRATAKLKSHLAKLDKQLLEFRERQKERDKLYFLVQELEDYSGVRKAEEDAGRPPALPGGDPSAKSAVWRGVRLVLESAGTDLSLEEIRLIMCKQGWNLEPRRGRENIRSAMVNHSEVFERLGRGRYRLKK